MNFIIFYSDFLALNVYIGLCYYKLDYYDVSQEILSLYLQKHPDSVIATNLKACNYFRLYHGKAAETEIKTLLVSKNFLIANWRPSAVISLTKFTITSSGRTKRRLLRFHSAKIYYVIIWWFFERANQLCKFCLH